VSRGHLTHRCSMQRRVSFHLQRMLTIRAQVSRRQDRHPTSSSPQLRPSTALSSLSDYYQEAMRLLEGRHYGHELSLAHVYLLDGLYKAHCARVDESRVCFKKAGDKLYGLIIQWNLLIDDNDSDTQSVTRMQLIPKQQVLEGRLQGQILMSAWSCLQLETDNKGSSYPGSSSLHRIFGILPLPSCPCESKNPETSSPYDRHCHEPDFQNYLAVTFADRQLRLFRDELYGYHIPYLTLNEIRNSSHRLGKILLNWRETLPDGLRSLDGEKVP
jgi:hypothetical protein